MAWTTPMTWVAGSVVSAAQLNEQLRDNMVYLLSRPHQRIIRNAGYTTTSTTFVDIDSTNLSVTLTLSSGAALIGFNTTSRYDGVGLRGAFDVTIDGTRYAAASTLGIAHQEGMSGAFWMPMSYTVLAVGLTVGSHVFRPVWRANGTSAQIAAPVTFFVAEVA